MKIGMDTFACDGGKSGVGMYLTHFLKRVPPSQALFELFGWEYDRYIYSDVAPNFEFIPQCSIHGKTANAFWHLYKYPKFASLRQYEACFFPAAHRCLPSKSPCPTIGVIHDMAAYWGEDRKKETRLEALFRFIMPNSLRRLDIIIAVSEFVKQQLIERAHVKENRIEVVPNGIDTASFYPRQRNEESVLLIQPFSFRRPYVLCVSRIDHPLKNHVRLIEAFGIFKEKTKYPHRLVLAGVNSNNASVVREAASASPWRNDIFFTGHFPFKSLPELYAGSDFVVCPSIYEGFSMGVLEAMACGVPAICARASSHPEVADYAALYFDPYNAEDMADRMITVSTDRDIYNECRRLGLERSGAFSWDRCVERTLQIIYETAGK